MSLDLRDSAAVDEVADRDQHIFDEHRVIGRQQQFASRRAGTKCVRCDANLLDALAVRMSAEIDAAMADPAYRLSATRYGLHAIAGAQVLDGDLAVRCQDACAGGRSRWR